MHKLSTFKNPAWNTMLFVRFLILYLMLSIFPYMHLSNLQVLMLLLIFMYMLGVLVSG